MSLFQVEGTEHQQQVIADALARCTFRFDRVTPGLTRETGRDHVPVVWADLSRYAAAESEEELQAHVVVARGRVLGLAYYSGKIALDVTLEHEPLLAGEVFLSEAAHMVDFFLLDDRQRRAIWDALHPGDPANVAVLESGEVEHGHGWFDAGTYAEEAGEAWMGLFVRSFSDLPVTITFAHPPTDQAVARVRELLGDVAPLFAQKGSAVYHDRHKGRRRDREFWTPEEARDAGLTPCRGCRPLTWLPGAPS